jgi:hypothetical protein
VERLKEQHIDDVCQMNLMREEMVLLRGGLKVIAEDTDGTADEMQERARHVLRESALGEK